METLPDHPLTVSPLSGGHGQCYYSVIDETSVHAGDEGHALLLGCKVGETCLC